MNVRDVMRRDVITIEPDASIADAIMKMTNDRITSLIVGKTIDGSVYWIITRKDIVNKVIAYDKDLKATKVSDIMSEPILSISADQTVEAVARLMAKTDIRRFPVMEDSRLIGLISNSDILRAVNRELEGK
jgi:CBS domain-containing protein